MTKKRTVGFITASPSASLMGIAAVVGVDFVVLDAEQTGLTIRDCEEAVSRLRHRGVWAAIRVPDLRENTLVEFANTGADELVLPRVRRIEELEVASRAVQFPPRGSRPKQVTAATDYGTKFDHEPLLTVLFETVDALDRVSEFAESPYFGGGWVGPTDLAAELSAANREESLYEASQRIIDVVSGAGHSIGIPASGFDRTEEVFARGADRGALYWEREATAILRQFVATKEQATAS